QALRCGRAGGAEEEVPEPAIAGGRGGGCWRESGCVRCRALRLLILCTDHARRRACQPQDDPCQTNGTKSHRKTFPIRLAEAQQGRRDHTDPPALTPSCYARNISMRLFRLLLRPVCALIDPLLDQLDLVI